MATHEFELGPTPDHARARELWLQHAAGFILFEDAREYALGKIDRSLDDHAKEAVRKAIDDALYGMMMIIDGVSGRLRNAERLVSLRVSARLERTSDDGSSDVVEELALLEGDGMCMGFQRWRQGDFGASPVATRRSSGS